MRFNRKSLAIRITMKFLQILHAPIILASRLVPKNPHGAVFGSWFGLTYSDNPRYLFEYLSVNHPELQAIWLSRSKQVRNFVRMAGHESYHSYSPRGYWYSMRSKWAVYAVSEADINRFVVPAKRLNLWHGSPVKRIGRDVLIKDQGFRFASCGPKLRKIAKQPATMFISSSEQEKFRLVSALSLQPDDVSITGLPRADFLMGLNARQPGNQVLYMPTFRPSNSFDCVRHFFQHSAEIDAALIRRDMELSVKLHAHASKGTERLSASSIRHFVGSSPTVDPLSLLEQADILVTDFSSVIFDFLLLERPIILLVPDIESYSKNPGLYINLEDDAPGPLCRTWAEVFSWIDSFKSNPDLFAVERRRWKAESNHYLDGGNCSRVAKILIDQAA